MSRFPLTDKTNVRFFANFFLSFTLTMDILHADIDVALINLTLPSLCIVLGFIRIFCLYMPWGRKELNELW